MEQASNTFNKGLQLDTHPMVQGNDSLTDCLNGTLVTMNGNEVILQNDMGNRRVDNAFLPAGYQPVGIKEFGGIIYVAAYNPITNRSQVGSFPSPERKIGIFDDNNLGGNISPSNFTASEYSDLDGLFCLDSDTVQVPLTNKTSLHAGDKFVIYYNTNDYNDWFNSENLSNFNNISETKIKSSKNKKYTAQIGILNSQNNFVDITKNLCRWTTESPVGEYIDTTNKPDLYKFNVGYFIKPNGSNVNFTAPDTINDNIFQQERQLNTSLVNTYSYKLVGPMYMQLKVNHIQSFDYNIWGSFENGTLTLSVEGTATYNCPDTLPGKEGTGGSNETYSSFELLTSFNENREDDFIMFDLFQSVNGECVPINYRQSNDQDKFYILKKGVFNYDPVSNLYTAKLTKEYIIKNFTDDIFSYVIGVRTPLDINGRNTYLAGLSSKGQIDINLLGSGDTNARRWQFKYNTDNSIDLRYSFDFYPKPDETLSKLTANLTNIQNAQDTKSIVLFDTISTGTQSKTIKVFGLTPKALYRVKLSYVINGEEPYQDYNHNEFILTTELFNDCFSRGKNQIIDYGWPGGVQCTNISSSTKINDDTSQEIKVFKDKLEIKPYISIIVNKDSTTIKESQEGNFIKKGNPLLDKINVIYKQYIDPTFEIQDTHFRIKDLYPSFITANNNATMKIARAVTNIDEIKQNIKEIYGLSDSTVNNLIQQQITVNNGEKSYVNLNLTWKDIFECKSIKFDGEIENVFDTVKNYLDDHFNYNKKDTITKISCPTVMQLMGHMMSRHRDVHALIVGKLNLPKDKNIRGFYNVMLTFHDCGDSDQLNRLSERYEFDKIYSDIHDGTQTIIFSQYADNIYSSLQKYSSKTKDNNLELEPVFLYAFGDSESKDFVRGYLTREDVGDSNKVETISGNKLVSRVWWRAVNSESAKYPFVLVNKLLEVTESSIQNDIQKYFKQLFKVPGYELDEIVFCRYKKFKLNGYIQPDTNIDRSSLIKPYSCRIPYTISLTFVPSSSSTQLINGINNSNNDILKFYLNSTNITDTKEILEGISSSNKYRDLYENGPSNVLKLSNIDLAGNEYKDKNKIYVYQQGTEITDCNYKGELFSQGNEYQLLYYNNPNSSRTGESTALKYQYDYFDDTEEHHTRTYFAYDNPFIVNLNT